MSSSLVCVTGVITWAGVLLIHRLDELLPIYVVFRTPLLEDEALKSYLDRLAVNLDVFAFGTAPGPDQEMKALPKELIYSETIKDTNEPTIVLHENDDGKHAYVFWKVEVAIGKPHALVFQSFSLMICSSSAGQISQAGNILPANRVSEAGRYRSQTIIQR